MSLDVFAFFSRFPVSSQDGFLSISPVPIRVQSLVDIWHFAILPPTNKVLTKNPSET